MHTAHKYACEVLTSSRLLFAEAHMDKGCSTLCCGGGRRSTGRPLMVSKNSNIKINSLNHTFLIKNDLKAPIPAEEEPERKNLL